MADCSYFRCMQERRFIKRELLKWTKNMVYIVGLERIAEELMGRRKWKQYQESLTQSHATDLLVKQSPSIEEQQETSNKHQKNCENNKTGIKTEILDIKEENKLMTTEDVSEKLESSNNNSTKIEEIKVEGKSEPVDWKPQDKCYFCVDGKLLKVNESGEVVVETGPVQPEAELNKHIIESEDSSDIDSDNIQKNNQPSIQKNLEALLKTIGLNPNNMTSLESMAAQLAAFQRLQTPELNQMNPFYPNLFYQFPQVSPTTTPDRTSSPLVKTPTSVEVSSPSPGQTMGEQPLDLSAKPSGSMVFKAKPRISTVPGRRSYTEEELNNALQDILSGKLGTRRAAVLYGIPRSTLRNKVYKLAIEQKRELLADHPPIAVLEEEDDKDSEGPDDDKDVLKMGNSGDQLQSYLKFLQKSSESLKQEQQKESQSPVGMPPSSWPIDPATWLQSLIIANGLQGLGNFPQLMMQQSTSSSSSSKEELPEFLRKLLTQPQDGKSGHHDEKDRNSNNGMPNQIDPIMMINLLQKQNLLNKPRSSNTPDNDNDGTSDDSSAILKIPSIVPKTLFGSGATSSSASSTQSKNGDVSHSTPSTSPQIAGLSISPHGMQQGSSALANHLAIRSPSLMRQRSESNSPPGTAKFNLNDVIRQSISKNFQTSVFDDSKHSTPLSIDPMDSYQHHHHKRPVISVIKNLGGTDISKFGTNPNVNQMQQGQLSPNTGTGGKGTRPKRGKYRNYDRDSLVEAVKAVQRGEMSVHRAGSYYGVPHSTLEYKVKERHLMRPRKREPKPQPGLDSTSTSSASVSTIKRDFPAMDKTKTNTKAPPLKPPYTSPNGIKMQPFMDPASMAQLQMQSQLLWPHPSAFPGLGALDFATRSSSQNNSTPFPSNAEFFAAQQMLQKFQEQQQQQQQQQQQFKPPVNGNESSKQQIEGLYDPVSTNGSSFLDGIIRSTLDKKPGGTLFEHLLKKGSLPNSSGASDNDDDLKSNSLKRPGSPMNFSQRPDIKRERSSPSPNHDNDADDYVSKLRENLTTTMIKEELNNGSLNNSDDVNSS